MIEMRFIHTSDWHLGKAIKTKDRYDEAKTLLDEIGAFAENEKIDFIVIAGDLFDTHSPPAEAEKVAYSFFCRMNKSGIPLVIIAGNHDSYDRFDSRADLFAIANVNVFGTPKGDAVCNLKTKNGETARIGCLPFLSSRFLLKADATFQLTAGEMKASYSEKVGKAIGMISRQFTPGAVNILVSHLFLQGAIPSYTESPPDISAFYAVATPAIPAGAQYCCLGHIHKRQRLERASSPAYYCGSIMKLDFGEEKDEKGFLVVEATPNEPPTVEEIKLQAVEPVLTVDVEIAELSQRAEEIRKLFWRGYGKIRVHLKKPVPNLREMVKHEVPEAVAVDAVLPVFEEEKELERPVQLSELMDPVQIFSAFYREEYQQEPAEDHLKILRQLYEETLRAEQENKD